MSGSSRSDMSGSRCPGVPCETIQWGSPGAAPARGGDSAPVRRPQTTAAGTPFDGTGNRLRPSRRDSLLPAAHGIKLVCLISGASWQRMARCPTSPSIGLATKVIAGTLVSSWLRGRAGPAWRAPAGPRPRALSPLALEARGLLDGQRRDLASHRPDPGQKGGGGGFARVAWLLKAYSLPSRTVPLPPDALELVATSYAGTDEAGRGGSGDPYAALLQRAISQDAPTRRVWITPEVLAERLGPRPKSEVQQRTVGVGPARMVAEPESLGGVSAVSGLKPPAPRLQDQPLVRVVGERWELARARLWGRSFPHGVGVTVPAAQPLHAGGG